MSNREKLIEKTNEFFSKHWNIDSLPPSWSEHWAWVGPVPNYNLGGLYPDSGLSKRLMAHVYRSAPKGSSQDAVPREKWDELGVTSISTIGFKTEFNYLASALEDFLIGEINPPQNSVKRKSS